MHAQAHHHGAVQGAAGEADAHAEEQPDEDGRDAASRRVRPRRNEGHGHAGESVDRAHGEVDPRRDDDDRGAHRHDREEAGVGGGLDEGVGVEEVVHGPARHPVRVGAREEGEQRPQQQDHEHEAGLRRAQEASEEGGHGRGLYGEGVPGERPRALARERAYFVPGRDLHGARARSGRADAASSSATSRRARSRRRPAPSARSRRPRPPACSNRWERRPIARGEGRAQRLRFRGGGPREAAARPLRLPGHRRRRRSHPACES